MAKKVLSILCAIAMMVTMLSVGMISVFAADNLGTVTRGEKSFGSLAWADSTYSAQEGYAYAGQKYYAFFNTEATGDAIMGRGKNVAVTLTNKEKVTFDGDFEFSFRYSYYQNATYRLMPYANIAIGGMNIRVQTVEDESTNTAPTVAITYGNTSLSVKATSYSEYTDDEITNMYNTGKAAQQAGVTYAVTTWGDTSVVPKRYVDVSVRYSQGTLSLNVGAATDSKEVALNISDATVAYTVGNEDGASNVGVGLSNWSGSYFSEDYIEGDSGEGDEGGNDSVEYADFGSFAWADSTYSAQEGYAYAGQKYYAFFNTEATGDAIMGRGQNVAVTLTNNNTVSLGDNFEFSFRYSYYPQDNSYRTIPYANIAIGSMNIRMQAIGDDESSVPTAVLTYGNTTLSVKTTNVGVFSSSEITAMFEAGKAAKQTGVTYAVTTWSGNYVVGSRYVDVNVKYENGTLTLSVAGSGAAVTDSKAIALDLNNVSFAATVGDGNYNVAAGLSNWSGKYALSSGDEEDNGYKVNVDNGADLLATDAVTGYTTLADNYGLDKSFYAASDKVNNWTFDKNALWSLKFNYVNTATSTTNYILGDNFELSADLALSNQAVGNSSEGYIKIGDVKLSITHTGPAPATVVVKLEKGGEILGTKTGEFTQVSEGNLVANGKVQDKYFNGTYTLKYADGKLTVLYERDDLTFDNGSSSFPIDAAAFNNVKFEASVKGNGRTIFIANTNYVNKSPVIDKDLKFYGASLTLDNGIGMNFYVGSDVTSAYTDLTASVKYIENGEEATKTYSLTDIDGFKGFTFNYYSPNQKDVPVYVSLIGTKNGKVGQGAEVQYSINAYMNNMTSKYSNDEKLMNVIDALDEYCDATAAYAAGEDYSYGKTPVVLTKDSDYHLDIQLGGSDVLFAGCSLNIREVPSVIFAFRTKENIYNYTFEITKENGFSETITADKFVNANSPTEDGDLYYIYFRDVTAVEMRNTITGQMFNKNTGEAASDAITYSVVSYAYYQAQKAEKTILYDLTQAMIAYGDAVVAYVAE